MATTISHCKDCGESGTHYVLTICVRNLKTKNIALTAERDKYRDALAEHTSWKPDVGIIPPIPMSHGTCCCCGKCGRDHDECVCTHNEIEQFLARQVKAELEGE